MVKVFDHLPCIDIMKLERQYIGQGHGNTILYLITLLCLVHLLCCCSVQQQLHHLCCTKAPTHFRGLEMVFKKDGLLKDYLSLDISLVPKSSKCQFFEIILVPASR